MAKETTERHAAAALSHIAAELQDHAASLLASAALLNVDPAIPDIDVRYENSRKIGLEYLRNWVSAVKQAAYDARLEASQNHTKKPSIRISATAKKGDTK